MPTKGLRRVSSARTYELSSDEVGSSLARGGQEEAAGNGNNLKNVPQSIYEMKELECLLLSRNKLKTIPTKLYMLNLYQLDLSFNLISEIPIKTAQNLARITIVDLSNNPINDPPLQVILNSI